MAYLYRFVRSLRSMCAPLAAIIGFSCLLTFIFILYQPTPGPGIKQRLGWQSWDSVSPGSGDLATVASNSSASNQAGDQPAHADLPDGVDWWNVSGVLGSGQDTVDTASLPLDVWAPLLPHETGLSEIAVTHCLMNPDMAAELCAPSTTKEKDAIRGPWVRVHRNLNMQSGYMSGYVSLYYRRTRRLDINLVDKIELLPATREPFPLDGWSKAASSLRSGVYHAEPLFLWYHVGKTAGEMTAEEKTEIITEMDVLFGDDVPWWGFQRIEPPTMLKVEGRVENTHIVIRRGVKPVPRAPPLHFSRDGRFKIMQIADLHYSVSVGKCREVEPDSPISAACANGPGSDNLTSTLLAHMLDVEQPDLVVFTGDQLNGQGSSWDPKSVLAKFAKEVWGRGIPWAAIFGNHDSENGLGREDQMKIMEALPYSVVQSGPKDVHGVGNYVLKVRSADPSMTHLLTLYFLDSGSYSKGFFNFWGMFTPTAYDWIKQNQIDWFLRESASIPAIERPFTPDGAKDLTSIWARQSDQNDQLTPQTHKLAKPNGMMFFHIPLPEAYSSADQNPRNHIKLDVGIHDNEPPGNAQGTDGFFEKALLEATESNHVNAQGAGQAPKQEVKVVANGHCHITENCRRVKGVWMCFGGGGSYSGYSKIGFDRRFRIYEISDYGEKIRTWKRTEGTKSEPDGKIIDDLVLAGPGAAPI